MEKNVKRLDFVRLRINSIEKERLLNVEKLTGRKKSDILREAIYKFIKADYPQFLNYYMNINILTFHFCLLLSTLI